MNHRKPLIAIEGTIGVGKSTLVTRLSHEYNFRALYEPIEHNIYLDKFYEDMKRWSFPMQIHLLFHHYNLHVLGSMEKIYGDRDGIVLDRCILGTSIFASMHRRLGLFSELEYCTYRGILDKMLLEITPPDAVFFLDVDPKKALERINQRNRSCEAGMTLDYLRMLDDEYRGLQDNVLSGNHPWSGRTRIVLIDWNSYSSISLGEITRHIKSLLGESNG